MRMTPPWTHISESLVLSETMGGRLGDATLLEYLWPCYRRCVTGSGFLGCSSSCQAQSAHLFLPRPSISACVSDVSSQPDACIPSALFPAMMITD